MAIVTLENIRDFLDSPVASENALITTIHDAVEDSISGLCKRTFESTSYTLEAYNGTGRQLLNLNQYPVTALSRLVIGAIDVIRITNTAANSWASVSVTSTGLVLDKDGTSDATILFATYPTMTTLVAAVNALGNSWSASLPGSTYGSFKSSELLECFGKACINSRWVSLQMMDTAAEYDFEVKTDAGQIYLPVGFPIGINNIFVSYTAGYTTTTMPERLKLAVCIWTKYLYQRRNEETFGTYRYSIGGTSVGFVRDMPEEVAATIGYYMKRRI